MIEPSDYLFVDSLQKAAQANGLLFAGTADADSLFSQTRTGKHVVVSACCDAGVSFLEKEHPNADLIKMAASIDYESFAVDRRAFWRVEMGPCISTTDRVNMGDRFAVKCDRYTFWSFTRLPEWVEKWYSPNLNVDPQTAKAERMEWIPFGLLNDESRMKYLPNYVGRKKTELCYSNFSLTSYQRIRLKEQLPLTCPWMTHRNADLPIERYFEEMSSHFFVVNPWGNGKSSYRVCEASLLGCVVLMPNCHLTNYYIETGFPVIPVQDFTTLTPEYLSEKLYLETIEKANYQALSRKYWEERVCGKIT